MAASPCLVQVRFPSANLNCVLGEGPDSKPPGGIIGNRVPVGTSASHGLGAWPVPPVLNIVLFALPRGTARPPSRGPWCHRRHRFLSGETEFRPVAPHAVQHHTDPPGQRDRGALP